MIAQLLEECQSKKTSDGRFTTTSLEQIVDVLRDNSGDTDLLCAAIVRETLNQVARTDWGGGDCKTDNLEPITEIGLFFGECCLLLLYRMVSVDSLNIDALNVDSLR